MAVTWLLSRLTLALHELCWLTQQPALAPLPGCDDSVGDR